MYICYMVQKVKTKDILEVIDTAVDGYLVELLDNEFKIKHKAKDNKVNIYIERKEFKLSEVSFQVLNLQNYFKYKYNCKFIYEIIYKNNHYTTYHTFPFYNYKLVKAIKVTAILYNESER